MAEHQQKPADEKPVGKKPLALYIHWPFCAKKCPYCDFNSHVRDQVDQEGWARAMVREIGYYGDSYPRHRISSIFFGGGTPSLMPAQTVDAILKSVDDYWGIDDDVEITLEANPSSVEADRFQGFRAAGVNRLSLGVQSLRDDALTFLGRLHSTEAAISALKVARDTFERVSIDLIYCRPDQSVKAWGEELEQALEFGLSHLSLYQLTLEPGTGFYGRAKRGELILPDADHAADMFDFTQTRLTEAGLPAYETSNHARPGQESRHNMTYWTGGHYIGVGPGAHGRLPGPKPGSALATANIKRPETWLNAVSMDSHGQETADAVLIEDRLDEIVLMGLRLKTGLDLDHIAADMGISILDHINTKALADLQDEGLLAVTDGRLHATDAGWPLVGGITSALLT